MKRMRSRIEAGWDQLEITLPVPFCDLDPMGRVWHGHYLRYCEQAREAYCASRGLSYADMASQGCQAPVVRLHIEYLAPARMGEEVRVRVAHVPDSAPGLELRYEILGPAPERRLLMLAESMQLFMGEDGAALLELPQAAAAFLERLAAGVRRARAVDGR